MTIKILEWPCEISSWNFVWLKDFQPYSSVFLNIRSLDAIIPFNVINCMALGQHSITDRSLHSLYL